VIFSPQLELIQRYTPHHGYLHTSLQLCLTRLFHSSLLLLAGLFITGHRDMLERVHKRAYQMRFTFQYYDFDDLNEIAKYKLFRSSRSLP